MSTTDVLAIYGAVVATVGAGAQAGAVWRDRPQLTVSAGVSSARGQRPVAWIEVHNHGTRPTTVLSVGWFARRVDFQTSDLTGEGEMRFPISESPEYLEPGQTFRVHGTPPTPDYGYHADHPLRPYAIDGRKRRIWGKAGAVVRWVVGPDPPLNESDDESFKMLFVARERPFLPEPVEPWWKLWKPREQRFRNHYHP